MNLNSISSSVYWDGSALAKDSGSLSNLLIVMVVFLVFAVIGPLTITVWQVLKFKKQKFVKSYASKLLISSIFTFLGLSTVLMICAFIFFYGGGFMSQDQAGTAYILVIAFISVTAAFCVAVYIILIFANQYVALGVSEDIIYVFGENYDAKKIISVVEDEKVKKISIHFAIGKRVVKRVRFGLTSMSAQCLKESLDVIKVKAINGNDREIYVEENRKRQEEFRQSLTKALENAAANVKKADVNKAEAKSESTKKAEKEDK